VTASTQREHAGQRRAPPHHAPGPTGAIPRARALAVTGQRALVAQRAVMAGVTAVYRARYPAEWALESDRAGADRRWTPAGMARRLIGLLRADDALPLRDEASLAEDDAAVRARPPDYLFRIPLDGAQDYSSFLMSHGGAVRDAPAYMLLEWALTGRCLDGAPLDGTAAAEMVDLIALHGRPVADLARSVIARAEEMWEAWWADGAYAPSDMLRLDTAGACGRRRDGFANLPALVGYRADDLRARNGDVDDNDESGNPFLIWPSVDWGDPGDPGPLGWAVENVAALAGYWGEARDIQAATRRAWEALAAPNALLEVVPLLADALGAAPDGDRGR